MNFRGRFARFALVGVIGFGVDVAVLYFCLTALGFGVYSARVVSYFAAATTTWYLNRRITFAGFEAAQPLRQWFRFVLTNGFGGIVNYGVYSVVVSFAADIPFAPLVGVAAGSIAGLLLNFAASQAFVFRRASPSQTPR